MSAISRILPSALFSSHFVGSPWASLAMASPVTVALHLSHQLRTTHPHLEFPQTPWPQPTSNPRCLPAHSINLPSCFVFQSKWHQLLFLVKCLRVILYSFCDLLLYPINLQTPSGLLFYFLVILFMAVLGLHCCAGSPLIVTSGGYSVVEHRIPGWAVVVRGVSYYAACGTVPNQELNVYLPRWQADSLSLSHQGSPRFTFKTPPEYC